LGQRKVVAATGICRNVTQKIFTHTQMVPKAITMILVQKCVFKQSDLLFANKDTYSQYIYHIVCLCTSNIT
jgi:hypothetical protein